MNYAVKVSPLDRKYMGNEPVIKTLPITESDTQLVGYYNWHSYFFDAHVWKSWIVEYMSNSGEYSARQISLFKSAPLHYISNRMGVTAKLIGTGIELPLGFAWRLNHQIDLAIKEAEKRKNKGEVVAPIPVFNSFIADLEDELDILFKTNYKHVFSLYEHMAKAGITQSDAKAAIDYYKPILADVLANPKDFSGTKTQYKLYVKFLQMLVDDATKYYQNTKAVSKKPRVSKKKTVVVKTKPNSELIKKLNYKKDNVELKLVSINPESIIGSSGLIVFNDKYKTISILVANENETLTVKGTTIFNFNETLSFTKTVRKPEIIPELLSGNMTAVKRKLSEIKTKSKETTGRINSDTLILKAFK
jgi:hypothetical protein